MSLKKYKRFFTETSYMDGFKTTKDLFLEKTFDINKDVDFLFKKAFDHFFKLKNKFGLQSKEMLSYLDNIKLKMTNNNYSLFDADSSILKTEDCKQAHKINPIKIRIGFMERNKYDVEMNLITVGISSFILLNSLEIKFDFNTLNTSKTNIRNLKNAFTEYSVKSSISHELTHWLDDSIHNRQLSKILGLDSKDYEKLNKFGVNMSYFEINAQIHGIKNLKRSKKEFWDQMTLADVFFEYPALRNVYKDFIKNYNVEIADIWQKALFKRMHRENLLGKNMKLYADYKSMIECKEDHRVMWSGIF